MPNTLITLLRIPYLCHFCNTSLSTVLLIELSECLIRTTLLREDGWFCKRFWMNGFLKVSLPTFMTLMQRDCQISSTFNLKKVSTLYSCKKQQGPSFFTKLSWTHSNFRVANLRLAKTASDWLESAESQMSELDSCNLKKSTGKIGFVVIKHCCINCPQILREKIRLKIPRVLPSEYNGIFFIIIRCHHKIDFAGNTCRI